MFSHMNNGIKRTGAAIASLTAIATLGLGLVAPSAIAADASGDLDASDVTFRWGVNAESGGGAYFGGCNFLSAGAAGDNGASGLWAESKGLYKTTDGNVSILKPSADGTLVEPTWATKCTNEYGTNINGQTKGMTFKPTDAAEGTPAEQPTYSGNVVRITGGSGTVNPDTDSAHLEWKGSFSVVYYGGMTYWSMSDPVLDIKDGKGTITATASGYGADMEDATIWKQLESKQIHLADLQNTKVDVTDKGITLTPDYLGVAIDESIAGRNPQAEKTDVNAAWWGSFPTTWLEYAELTGQSSYWYTSDGGTNTIQPRKIADTIDVTYTATKPIVADPKVTVTPTANIDPAKETTLTVSGTGFVGDAAVNGAYVFVIDSSVWKPGQEFKMEYLKSAVGEASWVKPTDIKDGAFTTTVKIPADKLEQGKNYSVVTMAAHALALTNRTLDTATPLTLKKPVVLADVNDKTPHATDIQWLANSGITTGFEDKETGEVTFGGMRDVVRQDMAAFLYRLAGSPEFDPSTVKNPFSDVDSNTPHYKEILWLYKNGITTGFDNPDGSKRFGGMDKVVRQDMAAFLKRLADAKDAKPSLSEGKAFTDVDASTPHVKEIGWLTQTGVTGGFEDGTFGGMRTVVRQDMAAFLHRMNDNVLSKK